jgi:hypothetical protein
MAGSITVILGGLLSRWSDMRFSVSSNAGQVLSTGSLLLQKDEAGEQRLCFVSDRGTLITGGVIGEDGDLTAASQVLFREFFQVWGALGVTLTSQSR